MSQYLNLQIDIFCKIGRLQNDFTYRWGHDPTLQMVYKRNDKLMFDNILL